MNAQTQRPLMWPSNLQPPIDPMDTVRMARAQSLLTGKLIEGVCPKLTPAQAMDVLRWSGEVR